MRQKSGAEGPLQHLLQETMDAQCFGIRITLQQGEKTRLANRFQTLQVVRGDGAKHLAEFGRSLHENLFGNRVKRIRVRPSHRGGARGTAATRLPRWASCTKLHFKK